MFCTRLVAILTTLMLMGMFTGTSAADHKTSKVKLPALKIISPANGAIIENPVTVVFEIEADLSKMTIDAVKGGKMPTMKLLTRVGTNRYQYSLGSAKHGKHTIRVYWADFTHMKAISKVITVSVTVK